MFQIQWHERLCINCLKCVDVCPRSNLSVYRGMPRQAAENTCTGCGYCTAHCPSGSIYHVTLNRDYWGAWNPEVRNAAYRTARTRKLVIEGKGSDRKFLDWDNLVFLPGQLHTPPLLDSEPVDTAVVIGKRSRKPIHLETPILIGAMSFGSLSVEAKKALALGATAAGSMSNTGEGGMHPEERAAARHLTLQYSTGRFGVGQEDLKRADMIEIKIGQGAKPGLGGHLLADKITPEIARVRNLVELGARFRLGENAISPSRHLDIHSPEDLAARVASLRDVTDGVPIAIKIAGGEVEQDLAIVVAADPDVIVVDGGEGGTGAAPTIAKNHAGLPLLYLLGRTVRYLQRKGVRERFTLIAAGGLKGPADFAKALALGADAVYTAGYAKFGLGCVYCRSCESGSCPTGITTQDPALRKRLDVGQRAREVENLLAVATNEIAKLCRLTGCSGIRELAGGHLRALNREVADATGMPLAHLPSEGETP
ncbi:MAG: glutamate synthase-related protein [Deferrisomatales bacterium]|nr:glutamate synthase-related protein [Deferrisomatales bacterium]